MREVRPAKHATGGARPCRRLQLFSLKPEVNVQSIGLIQRDKIAGCRAPILAPGSIRVSARVSAQVSAQLTAKVSNTGPLATSKFSGLA